MLYNLNSKTKTYPDIVHICTMCSFARNKKKIELKSKKATKLIEVFIWALF